MQSVVGRQILAEQLHSHSSAVGPDLVDVKEDVSSSDHLSRASTVDAAGADEEEDAAITRFCADHTLFLTTAVLVALLLGVILRLAYRRPRALTAFVACYAGWFAVRLYTLSTQEREHHDHEGGINRNPNDRDELTSFLFEHFRSAWVVSREWVRATAEMLQAWFVVFFPFLRDLYLLVVPTAITAVKKALERFRELPPATQGVVVGLLLVLVLSVQVYAKMRQKLKRSRSFLPFASASRRWLGGSFRGDDRGTDEGEALDEEELLERKKNRAEFLKTAAYQGTFAIVAPTLWFLAALPYFPAGVGLAIVVTFLPLLLSFDSIVETAAQWCDHHLHFPRAGRQRHEDRSCDSRSSEVLPLPAQTQIQISTLDGPPSCHADELPNLVRALERANYWVAYWALWPLLCLAQSLATMNNYGGAGAAAGGLTAAGTIKDGGIPTSGVSSTSSSGAGRSVRMVLITGVWAAFYGGNVLSILFAKAVLFAQRVLREGSFFASSTSGSTKDEHEASNISDSNYRNPVRDGQDLLITPELVVAAASGSGAVVIGQRGIIAHQRAAPQEHEQSSFASSARQLGGLALTNTLAPAATSRTTSPEESDVVAPRFAEAAGTARRQSASQQILHGASTAATGVFARARSALFTLLSTNNDNIRLRLGGLFALGILASSYLAYQVLQLLSHFCAVGVWWGVAFASSTAARETAETVTEIRAILDAALVTSSTSTSSTSSNAKTKTMKSTSSPIAPSLSKAHRQHQQAALTTARALETSARRLACVVHVNVRRKLGFWMTSSLWYLFLVRVPLVSGLLYVWTPLFLLACFLLGDVASDRAVKALGVRWLYVKDQFLSSWASLSWRPARRTTVESNDSGLRAALLESGGGGATGRV